MKHRKGYLENIGVCFLALCIPALLAVETIQTYRFTTLEGNVRELEDSQNEILKNNKNLITEIGLLSSSSRIEKIALEEFGMRQATSDEIIRIEIQRAKTGMGNKNSAQ